MIRIGLSGCLGTMGQIISELIEQQDGVELVFGIDKRAGEIDVLYPVFSLPKEVNLSCDVIIDFSNAGNVDDLIDYCISNQVAAVIATTGLSEKQEEKIKEAARIIPIFRSANTSLGINVLLDLVKKATSILSDNFDIEIIEKHHNKKVDAPSGTAYMIASTINEELHHSMKYNYGRQGNDSKRLENEIGIHSVRGGTIPGEHIVIFAGLDEVIEIKHTALSKKIFAKQAIKAAEFIAHNKPQLYNMGDLLNQY